MLSNTSRRTQSPDTQEPVLWLGVLRVKVEEYYGAPPLEKMIQVVRLAEAMESYHQQWWDAAELLRAR